MKTEKIKIVIPREVMDFMDMYRHLNLASLLDIIKREKEIGDWFHLKSMQYTYGSTFEMIALIRLIMTGAVTGYELEVEEKKYRVILPSTAGAWQYIYVNENGIIKFADHLEYVHRLTEKQINAIEPRYMAFAEDVEKL